MNNFITQEAAASQAHSFTDIRAKWKSLADAREIAKEDIAALCIYKAMIAGEGKDGAIARIRKSFVPITNPVKLENGAYPYGSLDTALWLIKHSTFQSWLTEEEKTNLLNLSKEIKVTGKEIK
jgi:hypothetical protein